MYYTLMVKIKKFLLSMLTVSCMCAYLLICCEQRMSDCYISFTFCGYLIFVSSAEKVVTVLCFVTDHCGGRVE